MFSLYPTCLVEGILIFGSLQLLLNISKLSSASFWSLLKFPNLEGWQRFKEDTLIFFPRKPTKNILICTFVSKTETDGSALLVLAQNPLLRFPSSLQKVFTSFSSRHPSLFLAINADNMWLPSRRNNRKHRCTL